jgi:hypothetical protein
MFGVFCTTLMICATVIAFGSYVTLACFFSKETSAFLTPLALTRALRIGSAQPAQCIPVTSSTTTAGAAEGFVFALGGAVDAGPTTMSAMMIESASRMSIGITSCRRYTPVCHSERTH